MSRSRALRPLSLVVLTGLSVATAGCYSERIAPPGSLTAEHNVRVALTGVGAHDLASTIGDSASSVSGEIVRKDDAGLTLAVSRVEGAHSAVDWRGEHVTIPLGAIDHVGVRQLDRTRTAVAAVGVAVVSLALRSMFVRNEAVGGGTGAVGVGAQ